jgi:hypothetical protein
MPWANYVSFPFLILGILFDTRKNVSSSALFCSGIFFSLAVLSREGLFPAAISIILFSRLLEVLYKGSIRKFLVGFIFQLSGFFLPIALFLFYLWFFDLLGFWKILAFDIPKLYINSFFPHLKENFGVPNLYNITIIRLRSFDIRWLLIIVIIVSNLIFTLLNLIRLFQKRIVVEKNLLVISFSSLILLSSTMHIPEIFRIATGSIVGLIPLFYSLGKFKKPFFIGISFTLLTTLIIGNSGNYHAPNMNQYLIGEHTSSPKIFEGQQWPKYVQQYYQNIQEDFFLIKKLNCGIKYQYNSTTDGFLQALSPFHQFQFSPVFILDNIRFLRPELDILSMKKLPNDILILRTTDQGASSNVPPPNGFKIFSSYRTPINNQFLYLLVPASCN